MFLTIAAAANTVAGIPYGTILYLVGLVAIFYFLFIRPQQQRQKQHQTLVSSLQPNDRVVAAGGIYGTIVKVKDNSLVIKIAENTKIEVLKTSVAYKADEEKESAE